MRRACVGGPLGQGAKGCYPSDGPLQMVGSLMSCRRSIADGCCLLVSSLEIARSVSRVIGANARKREITRPEPFTIVVPGPKTGGMHAGRGRAYKGRG